VAPSQQSPIPGPNAFSTPWGRRRIDSELNAVRLPVIALKILGFVSEARKIQAACASLVWFIPACWFHSSCWQRAAVIGFKSACNKPVGECSSATHISSWRDHLVRPGGAEIFWCLSEVTWEAGPWASAGRPGLQHGSPVRSLTASSPRFCHSVHRASFEHRAWVRIRGINRHDHSYFSICRARAGFAVVGSELSTGVAKMPAETPSRGLKMQNVLVSPCSPPASGSSR